MLRGAKNLNQTLFSEVLLVPETYPTMTKFSQNNKEKNKIKIYFRLKLVFFHIKLKITYFGWMK
jgi:hypothetical protein